MWIDQCHQRCESVVGNAEDANSSVALRNILDQPVDGVVCIGRVIDGRGIQRTVQRASHHVIAFGAVFAAHVLHDADIAAFDDHLGRIVIATENRTEMRAGGLSGLRHSLVRRAREQDRRIFRTLGQNDDRVQLHAVAHGNHHVAFDVIEAGGDGRKRGRGFAGQVRGCAGLSAGRFSK